MPSKPAVPWVAGFLVSALAGTLWAQLKEGDQVPSLRIDRLLNTRIRSMEAFKGLLIEYVWVSASNPACKEAVTRINLLHDRYKKRGFAAIVLSKDLPGDLQSFIDGSGLRAPVAIERDLKSFDLFGFESFPSAALADPKGRILWVGHPLSLGPEDVEHHLRTVKSPFPLEERLRLKVSLPTGHEEIAKKVSAGDFGAAHAALAAAESSPGISEIDAALCAEARQAIEDLLEFETACAERAHVTKRYREEQLLWQRIARHFAGLEAAERAQKKAEKLAADPKATRELEASARLDEADRLARAGKTAEAIKVLEALLAGPLKETEAAKDAPPRLEALRKKARAGKEQAPRVRGGSEVEFSL
jgi:peroxiredoxin